MSEEPTPTAPVANFDDATARLLSFTEAMNVPRLYRAIYEQAKQVQATVVRYDAQRDLALKAAIDTLFTPTEWSELIVMKQKIDQLVADWDTNHPLAVGKPKATQQDGETMGGLP